MDISVGHFLDYLVFNEYSQRIVISIEGYGEEIEEEVYDDKDKIYEKYGDYTLDRLVVDDNRDFDYTYIILCVEEEEV